MIGTILGGVGLFLLGMVLLTDGLKALAGDSLRTFLARFTGGRLSAVAAGTAVTAIVQSSSATTLATIGFVSAGLLTFEQAIGVILGANLGTTSTGWLVSLLGLKLSLGKLALPLVGVGALLKLLTRERAAHAGLALAGFGLIFFGIETLQTGMAALSARIDPADLPGSGLGGRALLVVVGVVMTVVMQSSSAAMATTLTALHSGTLDLSQAAALAIGQNVGTTITAGLAAIGANVAARRTALAHVLFNVLTGALAFASLPWLVPALDRGLRALGMSSPALQLAAFHTAFNLGGVLLFLPLTGPYARLITRLIPERGPRLTRRLDQRAAGGPLALDVAGLTLRDTLQEALACQEGLLAGEARGPLLERLEAVRDAVTQTREFLGRARPGLQVAGGYERHLSLLHVLDHLDRLVECLREPLPSARIRAQEDYAAVERALMDAVHEVCAGLGRGEPLPAARMQEASTGIANARRAGRPRLLEAAARGEVDVALGAEVLEAVRWVDRIGFHVWRAVTHLALADPVGIPQAQIPRAAPAPAEVAREEAE
ncbi:MAG: Na/Pi cotransporter family protein [Planctomycetota bacterium]